MVAGANTSIQHKPPAVLAGLALRCRLAGVLVSVAFCALLAVCGAFRALSVCWWYNYTSRARCAQYTPVSVPCVNRLYKHQPRQLLAAALCRRCLAVFPSLRCVCVACWPRPSVSTYGGGILSPRGLRCPCQSINAPFYLFPAVLAAFRRFGGVQCWRGVLAPVSLVSVCL